MLEVGNSESLTQLRIDAKFWLEDFVNSFRYLLEPFQVQLMMLILIDPPTLTHHTPKIIIQLWQGIDVAQQRQARMVWEGDWTDSASPMYVLLSDISGDQVPGEYGNNDRVWLDTVAWRRKVLKQL